jgi:hypothetical protein
MPTHMTTKMINPYTKNRSPTHETNNTRHCHGMSAVHWQTEHAPWCGRWCRWGVPCRRNSGFLHLPESPESRASPGSCGDAHGCCCSTGQIGPMLIPSDSHLLSLIRPCALLRLSYFFSPRWAQWLPTHSPTAGSSHWI